MIDPQIVKRLDELLDEAKDISGAFVPAYGGENLHYELKRVADGIGSAAFELNKIATSLEIIQQALTE